MYERTTHDVVRGCRVSGLRGRSVEARSFLRCLYVQMYDAVLLYSTIPPRDKVPVLRVDALAEKGDIHMPTGLKVVL